MSTKSKNVLFHISENEYVFIIISKDGERKHFLYLLAYSVKLCTVLYVFLYTFLKEYAFKIECITFSGAMIWCLSSFVNENNDHYFLPSY